MIIAEVPGFFYLLLFEFLKLLAFIKLMFTPLIKSHPRALRFCHLSFEVSFVVIGFNFLVLIINLLNFIAQNCSNHLLNFEFVKVIVNCQIKVIHFKI